MTIKSPDFSTTLIEQLSFWLSAAALKGTDLEKLVTGTCERLSAAGFPLLRASISFSMLHPLYDALSFTWIRGQGVDVAGHQNRSQEKPERYLKSPYFVMVQNDLPHLRRRIDRGAAAGWEFPVFEELHDMGATDYLAFRQGFEEGDSRGMMGSWTTNAEGGFTEDMIRTLLHIQSNLAMAAKMAVLDKLAENMLSTYLGSGAGNRVLSGQTRRGDGDTIRAVLVMGDMRNSTALAETEGRQGYIDILNSFFDAIAMPFNSSGGEILSFIGDGFLAIYPCERHKRQSSIAAKAAMAAVRQATFRLAALNRARQDAGHDPIGYGLGLHVGNVMFGNVGLKSRLTFSTFGSAVNEVQRLESLTKQFGVPVVASQIFKSYCGGDWDMVGQETLRGSSRKVSVFTPGAENLITPGADQVTVESDDGSSEAERVMMLYRNLDLMQRGAAGRTR